VTQQAPSVPYLIQPSSSDVDDVRRTHRVSEVATLQARVSAAFERGKPWDPVGDAIHRFLAADDPQRPRLERLRMARQLIEAYGVAEVLIAESMVAENDAFRAFVEQRWPGARWRREIPVSAEMDSSPKRRISGVIDLLLEVPAGLVIFDHKSFPAESESAWRASARDHAPQLALYATAVRLATRASRIECWIHLPVAGALLAIKPK
jgi:ATP-dependent helicase/nuclease subunit A